MPSIGKCLLYTVLLLPLLLFTIQHVFTNKCLAILFICTSSLHYVYIHIYNYMNQGRIEGGLHWVHVHPPWPRGAHILGQYLAIYIQEPSLHPATERHN